MTEVWGSLEKSQSDPQTIESAISAAIAAHEADAEAHTGVGESLQSHKTEAIIDHVVGSVVADKMTLTETVWQTNFESLDRWVLVGHQYGTTWPGVTLWADSVDPVFSKMTTTISDRNLFFRIDKNSYFQTTMKVPEYPGVIGYAGFGWLNGTIYADGYGFKIEGQQVSGYWYYAGVAHTVILSGIHTADLHVYRAQYDRTTQTVYFYVDGVVSGSLVYGGGAVNDEWNILFYIKAATGQEQWLDIFNMVVAVEK